VTSDKKTETCPPMTRSATKKSSPTAASPMVPPGPVQMGRGRAGAYTYDWIENLFGLGMHSANEILPEFQNLKTGEMLPVGSRGPRMRVERLEPDRAVVFAWLLAKCVDEVVKVRR
jgi:hypothetical protein